MNTPVIVDSSALISLASETDANHAAAVRYSQALAHRGQPVILPGEVFTETVNVLGRKVGHPAAIALGNELLGAPEYMLVDTAPEVRQLAFAKFREQPGSVSLTDCLVMAFADHYETRDIFGFDDVFRRNGYQIAVQASGHY